ncbi:hypothetical protein [Maritalea sp.]|uniref:hypothetical protein n=1 Tax=Maritalea sp. TaxID=2003361 RepID=UPI003EF70D5D
MGTNPNSVALIGDIATDLGFKSVRPFLGLGEVERQPKVSSASFFLFDYAANFDTTRAQIKSIRESDDILVRFAPLICFVETPSKAIILECVDVGFDDILTLPWSVDKIRKRLSKQIDVKHTFFETNSYFGPDRRRFNENYDQHKYNTPSPGSGYRRYGFVRNSFSGVQIMSEKVVGKPPKRHGITSKAGVQHRVNIG